MTTTNHRALHALCREWGLTIEAVTVVGKAESHRILYANEAGKPTHAEGKRSATWHEQTDTLVVRVPATGLPKVETVLVFGPDLAPRLDVGDLTMRLWMGADALARQEAGA